MHKEIIAGIELTITDPNEIMGMGGPYVGNVFIDSVLMSKECVLSNFVYKEDADLIFFVKHHLEDQHYFTVNFYNLQNKTVYQFVRKFRLVHIKQFIDTNKLKIFHAFHDQLPDKQDIFNLNEEEFAEITNNQY